MVIDVELLLIPFSSYYYYYYFFYSHYHFDTRSVVVVAVVFPYVCLFMCKVRFCLSVFWWARVSGRGQHHLLLKSFPCGVESLMIQHSQGRRRRRRRRKYIAENKEPNEKKVSEKNRGKEIDVT